jgi:phosphoribosylformylglycinamidine cyclo-ligase
LERYSLTEKIEGFESILGEELLRATRIYVKPILEAKEKCEIHGIAHNRRSFYKAIKIS